MKTNLKYWTSYVSPAIMESLKGHNILPIFIIRTISNSPLIGKYSGTPIHLKGLTPSYELFKSYKYDSLISREEFEKKYLIELSQISIEKIMEKIEGMANSCNAIGVALLGYGKYEEDYRSILAGFLEGYGYGKINELIL
jgi:uncharacterized protein YeaO (DUF488 family)